VYSLLPIPFLVETKLAIRDKIILGSLMGLGLLASAATIPKLIGLHQLSSLSDVTWILANFSMWTVVEIYYGIIAASIPALRSLFETGFQKVRVASIRRSQIVDPHGTIASMRSENMMSTKSEIPAQGSQAISSLEQRSDSDALGYSGSQKSSRDLEKGLSFAEYESEKDWLVKRNSSARSPTS
jgi:hypothetical protein